MQVTQYSIVKTANPRRKILRTPPKQSMQNCTKATPQPQTSKRVLSASIKNLPTFKFNKHAMIKQAYASSS